MSQIMYVCPKCKKVFKAGGFDKKIKCPKCDDTFLKDMKIEFDDWNNLNQADKSSYINKCVGTDILIDDNINSNLSTQTTPKQNQRMISYKCKMCGGQIEVGEFDTTCTCDFCGTSQTLPKLNNDRKLNLYDRANHFRRNNDFDKAMSIYEQILNEDQTDAESYWSIVLCRYGIEYVEDPSNHKRIPTVNRAQYTSIFADEDYKSAINYADATQKIVYEKEAKVIDEIQKAILAISSKEEPFDVFICYKETDDFGRRTPDSVLANDLYHQLTQEGFKVFFSRITLEDKLGQEYEPYIFAALNSAKVMVVLGTKPEYFKAVWVKNEWARYLALIRSGANKMLIPAYKDMDPYDLPEEFSHLQAQDMTKLGFMQDLIRGIKKITNMNQKDNNFDEHNTTHNYQSSSTNALVKRGFMALEEKQWNEATSFFDRVLDLDAECSDAYLGKLLAELNMCEEKDLINCLNTFDDNINYKRATRFASAKQYKYLNDCSIQVRKRIEYDKKEKALKDLYNQKYKNNNLTIPEINDEIEKTNENITLSRRKMKNATIGFVVLLTMFIILVIIEVIYGQNEMVNLLMVVFLSALVLCLYERIIELKAIEDYIKSINQQRKMISEINATPTYDEFKRSMENSESK